MKKLCTLIACILLLITPLEMVSADTVTRIRVENVKVSDDELIEVPIVLENNPGICGAVLYISYNKELKLKSINKGIALSTLTMTKPQSLETNPIKLLWDGTDADDNDGSIAVLTFENPHKEGIYNIGVSYEKGDIIDGNLAEVNPVINAGYIEVVSKDSGSSSSSSDKDSSSSSSEKDSSSSSSEKDSSSSSSEKDSSSSSSEMDNRTRIRVESVKVSDEESIEVPIVLENNPGICGAVLYISYNKELKLKSVNKGTALSTLTMTKPQSLETNPIKLLWDGTDANDDDGSIVVLTFENPHKDGRYSISVSYEEGDIVDGSLTEVKPVINAGYIEVESKHSDSSSSSNKDSSSSSSEKDSSSSSSDKDSSSSSSDKDSSSSSSDKDSSSSSSDKDSSSSSSDKDSSSSSSDKDSSSSSSDKDSSSSSSEMDNRTRIRVEKVKASDEESIEVPIVLENNPGICGAVLYISYDEELKLKSVNKGTALSTLTMTKPKSLETSPIKLLWDGTDANNDDGSIVVLSFENPHKDGKYSISVSYEEGDIVDGSLTEVKPVINAGYIEVESKHSDSSSSSNKDSSSSSSDKDSSSSSSDKDSSSSSSDKDSSSSSSDKDSSSSSSDKDSSSSSSDKDSSSSSSDKDSSSSSSGKDSSSSSSEMDNRTRIRVEKVKASDEESIEVPIILENNPGICGVVLYISYDEELKLKSVNKGTALSTLTMTKPKSLDTNPIKLLWDGTDANDDDGSIVVLSFENPHKDGKYSISVSYEEGDIVDGSLTEVKPVINAGYIEVESKHSDSSSSSNKDSSSSSSDKDSSSSSSDKDSSSSSSDKDSSSSSSDKESSSSSSDKDSSSSSSDKDSSSSSSDKDSSSSSSDKDSSSSSSDKDSSSSSSDKDSSSSSSDKDSSSSSSDKDSSSSSSDKDSSSSSSDKDSSSSSSDKDSSSSSSDKDSSSSSSDKDSSSSSSDKDSSSSSSDKDSSSSSSDKDSSSSSSDKDSSSSSSDKDSSSSSKTKDGYEIVNTTSMNVITQRKGERMIVGDEALVRIAGVDPKLLHTSGKNGAYRCVVDERTGEVEGIVTAIKKGNIKLYQLDGKKKRTICKIKAEQPKLKNVLVLKTGKVKTLKLKGTKRIAESWVSSNPEVASVNASGVLIATKPGTTTITAKLGSHTYNCIVVVK